jgi:hypothetical protein
MKSIMDPTFEYVKSDDTDIRKTFARVRRDQEADAKKQSRFELGAAAKRALAQSIVDPLVDEPNGDAREPINRAHTGETG